MTVFDWLKGLFADSAERDADWIYVRCDRCGQLLRARVDLAHDLSVIYDPGGRIVGYFTRKILIGSQQCFNQVEVRVEFDPRRKPLKHEVTGGELISRDEYEAAQAE